MQNSEYYYTIITSTYNCGLDFILSAESIKSQQRSDIQWIVIDGQSDENTLKIINQYKDLIHTYITERDEGIYDAWNKAINYILGEWVIFLGAGDVFHNSTTLNTMFPILTASYPAKNLIYGMLDIYSPYDNHFLKKVGNNLSLNSLQNKFRPNVPIHPEVFQHRTLFNKNPVFDTSLKIVGDTDFLCRVFEPKHSKFVTITITNIKGGGISQNLKYSMEVFKEIKFILFKYNINVSRSKIFINHGYSLAKFLLSFIINDCFYWKIRRFLNK